MTINHAYYYKINDPVFNVLDLESIPKSPHGIKGFFITFRFDQEGIFGILFLCCR